MTRAHAVWVIYASLAMALLVTLLPLPMDWRGLRPDLVALALFYWALALPHRVGVATAFTVGVAQDLIEGAPGTVSQVRASSQELIKFAKQRGTALILVGHVTKDGSIAGPRVLEHMVDTVLAFEGERSHQYRILRAIKNRFGGTDEIGVFEMVETGLSEVPNPSELFLADRRDEVTGAVVFAGIEGSRPVLVEIEALVAPSTLASPRRNVVGWDSSRLAMLTAVLEARCGVPLSGRDIFLNVAGGLKIAETAADLAVAAALISKSWGNTRRSLISKTVGTAKSPIVHPIWTPRRFFRVAWSTPVIKP